MTDTQLYLAIGLPTLAVLIGVLINASYWSAMNGRIQSLENRMTALVARFNALGTRIEAKFDILVGKVMEMDNRLVRLEERLRH
jgi:hypothetical protein